MVLGSSPVTVTSPSDFAPASSKEFLDIQATVECGFTLKRVRDMTRTYSQVISVLYDYVSQMQNEGTDCGNVPRSKKQLIDLSRSSLMVTEVGDILACNKELNIDSIVWHHSDIPELETKIKNIAVKMSNNITLSTSVNITFNLGAYSFT